MRNLSIRFLLSSIIFIPLFAIALDNSWKVIGRSHVRSTGEMVTIPVTHSLQKESIESIRFHAVQGDIKILTADLYLDDGESINISIQKLIRSGLNSRIIPLELHNRHIKKVIVYYELQGTKFARINLMAQFKNDF